MTDSPDDPADRLRVDRWLWCARFFKSRSAAADAVRSGHVRLNGQRVKPAHAVKIGDALQLTLPRSAERDVAIAAIPARRGPGAGSRGNLCGEPGVDRAAPGGSRGALGASVLSAADSGQAR